MDGDKDNHPIDNQNNRSLIYITGGTLNLLEGSVIQNNNAYLEGGGIYFNRNESYPNILTMNGNARITNCYSRTSGGSIMFAVGNVQDFFHIGEASQIDNNQAANGAGIYCRSYNQATSSILSIGDQVQITNNQASNTGGGICFSGFRDGSNAASILTLSGNVLLSGNQATHGAGIYFYASNIGDHLAITEHASIKQNTASRNGGGCNIQATSSPVDVSVNNASITDNTAGTGGGMYLLTDAGATVNFSGSIFTGNKATNGASGTGGGIWIKNQSQDLGISAMLTNIILEQNQASAHAGGMALYSGAGMFLFQMTGGIVSNNLASQEGGGFVISNDGTGILTFNQSVFSRNTANGSGGGGIYFNSDNGSVLLTDNVKISENKADAVSTDFGNHGGGISAAEGSQIIMQSRTIQNNTSDSFGRVSFTRLKPGKYVLQETVAPEGYEATTTTHQVIVDIDGNVTINGFPADGYLLYNTSQTRSERPVIISVTEGDTSITGTGIPDASITVTLPNGTQLQTTVDINGMWAVTIPSDITLQVGQTIYANQTESGKTSSENASFVVQAYA